MAVTLNLNGRRRTAPAASPDTPLLYVLRNDMEINSCKYGCGVAICGACTVLMDGKAIRSCVTPAKSVGSAKITTLEALGSVEKMSILQQAFVEEQAAQCGYCISGMIMTAAAFLETNKNPSEEQIRGALAGNLCRCGTHTRIIKAVQRAAQDMSAQLPAKEKTA